jgi:hypothetical protein
MRDYIMFNTKQRTLAKNEFEKDFFKLMSNACFGKTMENLRNRVDMDFVTSNALWGDHATKMPRTLERKLASPLYNGHVVYNEDLAAIKKKKQLLVLNKPIYAGMAILDLSKLHMFEFHYDIILPRYKENAQLLFTDTDSLCYLIKTDDFYKDMLASKDLYDMSNFPRDSPFYDASNKKVLGKFKDECDGAAPSEFVGLRPKMYSFFKRWGKRKRRQARASSGVTSRSTSRTTTTCGASLPRRYWISSSTPFSTSFATSSTARKSPRERRCRPRPSARWDSVPTTTSDTC